MTFHRGPARAPKSFSMTRTALAFPLIILGLFLYTLCAFTMYFVDWISGRNLSRDLLG